MILSGHKPSLQPPPGLNFCPQGQGLTHPGHLLAVHGAASPGVTASVLHVPHPIYSQGRVRLQLYSRQCLLLAVLQAEGAVPALRSSSGAAPTHPAQPAAIPQGLQGSSSPGADKQPLHRIASVSAFAPTAAPGHRQDEATTHG